MTSGVTAAGAASVSAGFRDVAGQLRAGMPDVNAQIAAAIAAQVRAPVLSGRLASSVKAVSDATTATVTAGGGSVRYAGAQEYGSTRHHIRARRYLRTALEASLGRDVDLVSAGVQRRLDTIRGA